MGYFRTYMFEWDLFLVSLKSEVVVSVTHIPRTLMSTSAISESNFCKYSNGVCHFLERPLPFCFFDLGPRNVVSSVRFAVEYARPVENRLCA